MINALSHPQAIKMCLKCFKKLDETIMWKKCFLSFNIQDSWVIRRLLMASAITIDRSFFWIVENKLWFGDAYARHLLFNVFRFCEINNKKTTRKKSISSRAILNSKLCTAIYGNIISTRYCTIPFYSRAGGKSSNKCDHDNL